MCRAPLFFGAVNPFALLGLLSINDDDNSDVAGNDVHMGTALTHASFNGNVDMVSVLLDAGAAANKAAAAVASLSSEDLRSANMPQGVPVDAVYRAYAAKYLAMEKDIAKLSEEFADKNGAGDAKAGPAAAGGESKSAAGAAK